MVESFVFVVRHQTEWNAASSQSNEGYGLHLNSFGMEHVPCCQLCENREPASFVGRQQYDSCPYLCTNQIIITCFVKFISKN